MIGWWLCIVWACRSVPDDLATQRDALRAYHAAEVAREAGRTQAALEKIDEAIALRPRDALLVAWRADVVATTDPMAAAAALETLLAAHPDFHAARFNRAAYLARAGKVFEASEVLQGMVARGQTTAEAIRADADLAPHLEHPAMGFLPAPELELSARRLPSKVFRDAEIAWTIEVGAEAPRVTGEARGPLELVGVVETARAGRTELVYTFRALGEGTVTLGPLQVRSGALQGEVEASTVDAVAPLGAPEAAEVTLALGTPRGWVEGVEAATPIRRGDRVWVRTGAADRVQVRPPLAPLARFELRESEAPSWVLWAYPASVDRLTVRGPGGVLFDGAPSDAPEPSDR